MFTGLIEEVGVIQNIRRAQRSCVLTIGCRDVLNGSAVGDSIAVNGVCLTVTSMGSHSYTADVMAETMNRSSLGRMSPGDCVNLERAVPAGGRFGGHIVSGHIDGTGTVQTVEQDDNAVWYTVSAAPDLLRYIVEKGSVAVDGISLTVAYVDDTCFKVSVIPHTQQVTALRSRRTGDIVNLECDIIGKYVERLLTHPHSENSPENRKENRAGNRMESRVTEDFLRENGFF
ncbi:MAG: riboflavin synthase [Lachnospiraceae bacterium]|nr:riboflavin synthase [Lachnospiraceae bacterium]